MKVESIAECSKGSILQYFWPVLSDNRSWKTILVFFLSGRLRQVLLYVNTCYILSAIALAPNNWPHYIYNGKRKNS